MQYILMDLSDVVHYKGQQTVYMLPPLTKLDEILVQGHFCADVCVCVCVCVSTPEAMNN